MPAKLPVVTNNAGISLEMAVWVLHDDYDFVREERYVSATGLMKPVRHIVLPPRIEEGEKIVPDVEDYVATALGQAIHAGIEKAWSEGNHVEALQRLDFPKQLIDRVVVNPTPERLQSCRVTGIDPIPVYLEQRAVREIVVDGVTYKVGGKFDMVCEGRVTDTKSTSVWAWIKGGREDDYQRQMSIYRWLNPDKITEDFGRINFVFTDWAKADAAQKAAQGYPPRRVMHKDIPLVGTTEIEEWIRAKLRLIARCWELPEKEIPECTDTELWMSEPKFKYYLDAAKATAGYRSTKNFDSLLEANAFMAKKGGRGAVVTVPGAPRRCDYCAAFPLCTQKDKYRHD